MFAKRKSPLLYTFCRCVQRDVSSGSTEPNSLYSNNVANFEFKFFLLSQIRCVTAVLLRTFCLLRLHLRFAAALGKTRKNRKEEKYLLIIKEKERKEKIKEEFE